MSNSIFKKIVAAVLLVLFCISPRAVFAAEDKRSILEKILTLPVETVQQVDKTVSKTVFNLSEVKVTSARVSSRVSDDKLVNTASNVSLLTAEEIDQSGLRSVPEALSSKEGVTYTDDLGGGNSARVDLRGFGGEGKQALVLLDGIRAVEPVDNSVTWQLYPEQFLKSVEIRRGGGSTVYGEGALSGVISLQTKDPTEDFHFSSDNNLESFRGHTHFIDASGTYAGLGTYVGAYYENSDGYRQNADHEAAITMIKSTYDVTDLIRLKNVLYFADSQTGIAGPLSILEAEQDRRQKDPEGQFGDGFRDTLTQNALTVSYWIEPLNIELSNVFGYRFRDQDSEQSFGGFFGGTSVNEIETETYSDVVQASWAFDRGPVQSRMNLGFEWSIDDIYNPSSFNSFSFGPFDAERSIDRQMLGFFIQERLTFWERWSLELGIRFDDIDWDIYDLKTPELQKRKSAKSTSPSVGLEYKVAEPLAVYGRYSESFKVPDANTLIFETPGLFTPNTSIDPQTAHHYELGMKYIHPTYGQLRADVFYIETKKEILFNAISTTNENYDTVRDGVELAGEINMFKDLKLIGNYTYTSAEFDNGLFDGKDIPLVPEHKWTAGVLAAVTKELSASLTATAVRGQYALNDFNNIFPVEDYWTMASRISYKKDCWEVYFKSQNLFGEDYTPFPTSNGVNVVNLNPAPKWTWIVGVKIEV